jgi:hypothetical protein
MMRAGGTAHTRAARKQFPPYDNKHVPLHTGSHLVFRLRTLYEWNTLMVCWIAPRQIGHDGFFICVSWCAHASHTHT